MTKYLVFYYSTQIDAFHAADRAAAARCVGIRWGGMAGVTVRAEEPAEIEVTYDDQAAFWGADDSKWNATFGGYDLGCLVGQGRTPLDAIVDLLDQSEAVQS